MAVKTSFFEEEFIEILANYTLGEYIGFQPIGAGTVQTNYSIRTTKGSYIFRYYENRSKESVRFECDLCTYLKDNHYPCPARKGINKGNMWVSCGETFCDF